MASPSNFKNRVIQLAALCLAMLFSASLAGHITISFWNVGPNDDALMYRRWAEDFEKQTGITVHITPVGWGNFQQKYLTALAAGLPPDVGTTNLGGPFEFGKVGAVLDVSKHFPDDYAFFKDHFYDGGWDSFTFQGHVFGIPAEMSTVFLYYRKDIFASLGLAIPQTWSELDSVLAALNANDYQYGFVWPREQAWSLGMYTMPFGVDRYSEDGTHVMWQDHRFQQGFKFAIRLWNRWNMPVSRMARVVELFSLPADQKRLCMPLLIDYSARYFEILAHWPDSKDKWGTAPFPAADNGKSNPVFGGTAWVIFRTSEHPEAAMRWIRFVMSDERQKMRAIETMRNRGERNYLYLSPNKAVYDTPGLNLDAETISTIKSTLGSIHSRAPVPGAVQADRVLELSFERIRTEIGRYESHLCDALGVSRWQLKRAFAQGQHPHQLEKYLNTIDSVSVAELEKITPQGNAALEAGRDEFQKYYAGILEKLPEKEKAQDILDVAKIISLGLFLLLSFLVFIHPRARKFKASYLMIAPAVFLLLIFLLIPVIVSVYIAFTKYNPILPLSMADWVGWQNFKDILTGPQLWQSLARSFRFVLVVLPIQLFIGVLLAVGLDQSLKPDRLYKFFYFSPLVTSVVSVSLIWTALYLGTRYGWINSLLLSFGWIRDPVQFLDDPHTFLNAVIAMSIWHGLAFVILICLAGLQNIPRQLYEAARIDGAGAMARFFKITLPLLRPQIVFLIVIGTIGSMQVFEQIYIFGGGSDEPGTKFGPADSGMTMVPLIFRKGFEDLHMGQASAVAYVLFMVMLGLTFIYWKLLKSEVD